MVFTDRWITVRIALLRPWKGGLYKQVVFRTGSTVSTRHPVTDSLYPWGILQFRILILMRLLADIKLQYRYHYRTCHFYSAHFIVISDFTVIHNESQLGCTQRHIIYSYFIAISLSYTSGDILMHITHIYYSILQQARSWDQIICLINVKISVGLHLALWEAVHACTGIYWKVIRAALRVFLRQSTHFHQYLTWSWTCSSEGALEVQHWTVKHSVLPTRYNTTHAMGSLCWLQTWCKSCG